MIYINRLGVYYLFTGHKEWCRPGVNTSSMILRLWCTRPPSLYKSSSGVGNEAAHRHLEIQEFLILLYMFRLDKGIDKY